MAQKSQIQQFREAARKLEADESEERFSAALRQVAKHKPTTNREDGDPQTKAKPTKEGR